MTDIQIVTLNRENTRKGLRDEDVSEGSVPYVILAGEDLAALGTVANPLVTSGGGGGGGDASAANQLTLHGLIGEVDAAPTENTVLERLKVLEDALNAVTDGAELQVDVLTSGLPSGAATNATLSAMSGKLPASLGGKTAAASLSVTLATDEGATAVSLAALPDANLTAAEYDTSTTAFGDLSTTFTVTKRLTLSNVTTIRELRYHWSGDTIIVLSLDGTNDHVTVQPGESGTMDFYSNGLSETGDVYARWVADPARGNLTLTAVGVGA